MLNWWFLKEGGCPPGQMSNASYKYFPTMEALCLGHFQNLRVRVKWDLFNFFSFPRVVTLPDELLCCLLCQAINLRTFLLSTSFISGRNSGWTRCQASGASFHWRAATDITSPHLYSKGLFLKMRNNLWEKTSLRRWQKEPHLFWKVTKKKCDKMTIRAKRG